MNIIKPTRVKHTYTQSINSSPDKVFPLLCPVREIDWAVGWNPELIVTESGFAEKDCAFITKRKEEKDYWIITHHDPVKYEIEMYIVSPGTTVGKLEIKLDKDGDEKTKAVVTYSYTSLSSKGDEFVKNYTREKYLDFMKSWEDEINHYLLTGEMISK